MPFVRTCGIRMHYESFGRGPESIVLVHGNLASRKWWARAIPFLPPKRYTIFTPDLRGCGESDKPDAGYTVPEMAQDLAAFVAATRLRTFHLGGHSLGGAIALYYALDNRDVVKTLTLVAPVPPDGLLLPPELFTLMQEMRRSRNRMRDALLSFLPSVTVDSHFEELVDEALRCHAACFSDLPRSLAGLNFAGRLAALKIPTLIFWGDRDPIIPLDAARRIEEKIVGSRLVILVGIGHGPQVEVPAEFSQTLSVFLEANALGVPSTQRDQSPS